MTRSPKRIVWASVFLLWGLALGTLYVSGWLSRYLSARNRPFVWIAAAVFIGLAAWQWQRSAEGDVLRPRDLLGTLLFLLPLAVMVAVPGGTLGADEARSRGVSDLQPGAVPASAKPFPSPVFVGGTPEPRAPATLLDIVWATNSEAYANSIDLHPGSTVHVLGFVVNGGPGARPDSFVLTRFVITCCVADARAVGVAVIGPGASQKDNSWVLVDGTVDWTPGAQTAPGVPRATITATSIQVVPAPPNPYLS